MKNWLIPRSNSAKSLEGQQVSTLVCQTCGWDLQNGAYRAATGPEKKVSRNLEMFSKCFHKNKIASGAPQFDICFQAAITESAFCHFLPQAFSATDPPTKWSNPLSEKQGGRARHSARYAKSSALSDAKAIFDAIFQFWRSLHSSKSMLNDLLN